MLQDLDADHLPILLTAHLSPVFYPNKRPPSFSFQKARWDDFAFYFDSHCPFAEEYSSLSLSSAPALFSSLTLNAAKSSIPFGRIKRQPKAWWSAEVEEAVSERREAFTKEIKIIKLTSLLLNMPCLSSPRPRLRPGRRIALLSHLNLCTLSFVLSLTLLSLLLHSPNVPLPGSRLRSSPITGKLTFLYPSQRPYVAEPEATYSSSTEPRALRSLTHPLAALFFPAEFLAAASNSPRPLPLAVMKLPIPR